MAVERLCVDCGADISTRDRMAYLCVACWMNRKRRQNREYLKRTRGPRAGRVMHCPTLGCTGTWVQSRHNGRRKLCDECQKLQASYQHRIRYLQRASE